MYAKKHENEILKHKFQLTKNTESWMCFAVIVVVFVFVHGFELLNNSDGVCFTATTLAFVLHLLIRENILLNKKALKGQKWVFMNSFWFLMSLEIKFIEKNLRR